MNYVQTMQYIESLQQFGSVLGLASIQELCRRLNHPQNDLDFIHIAGTNGKGSTLAFITSILQEEGYCVGRYISPTIRDYRERIQVNGKMITKDGLCKCMEQVQCAVSEMVEDGFSHPTAFEIETVTAFLYFQSKKCDIVVLEAGLGGREDATNLINTTKVAVITSISMDHMKFLGNSLEEIAYAKSGIIKEKCKVVCNNANQTVNMVVQEECKKKNVDAMFIGENDAKHIKYGLEKQTFSYANYKKLEIHLAGLHQIENAIVAVEAVRQLTGQEMQCGSLFQISEKSIVAGLKKASWTGRFSILSKAPYFIVDGAHNEDGAKKLATSIQSYFTNKKIIYIMGVLKDKEYSKIIENTYFLAEHIITIRTPDNDRAMDSYELAKEVALFHKRVTVADSVEEAVEMGYLLADRNSVIIAFGSLSFLGPMITCIENRNNRRNVHDR